MEQPIVGLILERGKIEAFWPQFAPFIERALAFADGEMLATDVFERLCEETMQLWLVTLGQSILAVSVTEIVSHPQKLVLRVVLTAGERMGMWQKPLVSAFCTYAQTIGASTVEAVGRRGFVRKLAPLGFRERYTTVTKEVE